VEEIDGRVSTRREGFVPRSQLFSERDVARALRRMAHEVLEHNATLDHFVVIGLQTGGVAFSQRLGELLSELVGHDVPRGTIDVAYFRDDVGRQPLRDAALTSIPVDLSDHDVLLVDDVLFTGRSVRAALSALLEWGRPRTIQLAVMVDRGHRELPIRPDYVGKNLPTSLAEAVVATLDGVWIGNEDCG